MSWNPPGIELGKRRNGSGLHNRTYIVNIHYPHTVFITGWKLVFFSRGKIIKNNQYYTKLMFDTFILQTNKSKQTQ